MSSNIALSVVSVIFATYILFSTQKSNSIEYYEGLIKNNIDKAFTYVLPTSNAEFTLESEDADAIDYGTFDFIVVGAGSAGAVLATRLSEIASWKILLLEAGGEENDFSDIPAMLLYTQFSEMNWGYFTTPQTTCCQGMKSKRCMYPRGKVIGGCSTINALMYVRGNYRDFDNWAALGNDGWAYKDVLPYFKKSEDAQLLNSDFEYHGYEGEWYVDQSYPPAQTAHSFIQANQELGYETLDYNGKEQIGTSATQFNIKAGKRQSTGRAFLDSARARDNLIVATNAYATKIGFDGKTAKEVFFVRNNKLYSAKASKEILVSGGAINTPQLLMLSGIGPAEHLKEHGIIPIADLPVGTDLQDHMTFYGLTFRTNYTVTDVNLQDQIRDYVRGSGPLTSGGNSAAVSFIRSNNSDVPLLEIIFINSNSTTPMLGKPWNFDESFDEYFRELNPMTDVRFYLVLLHPKSKGRVSLKSADPLDFPEIDIRYFENEVDLDVMVEGIEHVFKLTRMEAFRKLDAKFVDLPICGQFEKYSEDFWKCALRHMTSTIYHPIRTAQMGVDPKSSVVDPLLRVHGISNLRVVDCSVFPATTSGHTNAPVIMIAEKIAHEIKDFYKVNQYSL